MIESFQLFGTVHLWTIFVIVILGFILIYPVKKYANDKLKIAIGISIGIFMIIQEIIDRGYHILVLNEPVKDNLPLHLCGISVFLVAILLINRNYEIFEVSYFWGLAGASISIITPDVAFVFPHLLNITFFLSHALIVIGVLYMIFVFGYRPTNKSFIKSYIITHLYVIFIGVINYILDTNYLFLCHKPDAETPLDFMGPWPWYIISLEIALILFWVILYLPYFLKDTQSKIQ
jgi:hypothetical integral membrane protein (TIGR02206 family)